MEALLTSVLPSVSLSEAVRLTSLLGGSGAGLLAVSNIGAAEPLEKVSEGESGPRLDLGLP